MPSPTSRRAAKGARLDDLDGLARAHLRARAHLEDIDRDEAARCPGRSSASDAQRHEVLAAVSHQSGTPRCSQA